MRVSRQAIGVLRVPAALSVALFVAVLLPAARAVAPATAQQAPLVGPLAVAGSHIVDEGRAGQAVVFRGVNITADGLGPIRGGIVDSAALSTLQGWGTDMVRLGISSDDFLQRCPGEVYDPNYRSDLSQAVDQLTASGIYVILDIQTSNPACLWSSPQNSEVVAVPGTDVLQTMSSLAATFGSNRLVGYEPFNEPQTCAQIVGGYERFVPSSSESNGVCSSEQSAARAWNDAGTAMVAGVNVNGIYALGKTYAAPGMDALYRAVMSSVPAGSPAPLVFLDANYFASDRGSFDSLAGPLAGAPNVVGVFHPYDCQDVSPPGTAEDGECREPTPEACATVGQRVGQLLTDPSTNSRWSRPVVFDEFNFPGGEQTYKGRIFSNLSVPISLYQHGYWINNMIAAIESDGGAGWGIFAMQNADIADASEPYTMTAPGISANTPTPWAPSSNDAPAVAAMQGKQLTCEEPPLGYG